ncbi:MAG: hypothetical protein AABX32_05405 [Nanoarchaeota archaeon]|mgnify:CR=1
MTIENIQKEISKFDSIIERKEDDLNLNLSIFQHVSNEHLTLWVFSLSIFLGLLAGVTGNFLHNVIYLHLRNYYYQIMIFIILLFLSCILWILIRYSRSRRTKNERTKEFSRKILETSRLFDEGRGKIDQNMKMLGKEARIMKDILNKIK